MAETYLFAKFFRQILFIRPIHQTLTPPNIPAIRYIRTYLSIHMHIAGICLAITVLTV